MAGVVKGEVAAGKVGAPKPRLAIRLGKVVMRTLDAFLARHSQVATTPFIDPTAFAWVPALEAKANAIRTELDGIMRHPQDIPAFHEMSPDQVRISKGNNWKTYPMRVFGHRIEDNCTACPSTAALIDGLPGIQNAWFSILAPGYHIPPHRGPTKALVRCHLGLRIPADAANCWIRVGDQVRHWEDGQCLLFDDTYEHEVRNDTAESRVVLFLDVERPLDRAGESCRKLVLALFRMTAYVKRPLANIKRWNQGLQRR